MAWMYTFPPAGTIMELDKQVAFGSEVHILSTVPLETRNHILEQQGIDFDKIANVRIIHHEVCMLLNLSWAVPESA